MFKQLLGLDRLHWAFLLFGLAIAALAFMIWYPELVGAVGWERGEYVTIDSTVAQIISYLIVSLILWFLYIVGFWLLLRILAGSKRQYQEDKRTVVGVIILAVNLFILPKAIEVINYIAGLLINISIGALLLAIPLIAFVLTMQLLRFITYMRS